MIKTIVLLSAMICAMPLWASEFDKEKTAAVQSTGKYRVPVVEPPVKGPVDAEARAMFDEQIKIRFADKVTKLEEHEKGGWSWIAALPKDKQQIIDEERRKLLTFDDDERQDIWRFVSSQMESLKMRRAEDAERAKREATGRAERETMAQREVEAEQRRIAERDARQKAEQMKVEERRAAETEKKELTKIEMDSIVADALLRAADQVDKSDFLKTYWVTADEIVAAASGKQTSLERDQKKAELWRRAMPHPREARIRALFVPFPSGLPYVVSDVSLRDGAITLSLKGREAKAGDKDDPLASQDAVPAGTLRAISHGLLSPHLPNRFEYVKLKVPADADEIASLKKGDAVTSGEWLMPVIINDSGVIRANLYFYRTKKELLKLWGQVE